MGNRYAVAGCAVLVLCGACVTASISRPATATEDSRTCDGLRATIVGTAADDEIIGTYNSDVIAAGAGDDVIRGGGWEDRICGKAGHDRIRGGWGHDRIFGGPGNDSLRTSYGLDDLFGGPGDDLLHNPGGHPIHTVRVNPVDGGPGNDIFSDVAVSFRSSPIPVLIDPSTDVVVGHGVDTFLGAAALVGSWHFGSIEGSDGRDSTWFFDRITRAQF